MLMSAESILRAVSTLARAKIALVAPSMEILGGQGVQARYLHEKLLGEGHEVLFIPVNPKFPWGLRWLRQVPYLRTLLNQFLYLPSLFAIRHTDVVHVYSASYWSFLLAPVPAMLIARLFGKHLILNYHSGEAQDHLEHWGKRVHPWLRLPDEIVVPSRYLQQVFACYQYPARVIRNIVDTSTFRFRQRTTLQPRILSVRNLESIYRVNITILAFALLKRVYPDATLTIVGYGSQDRSLRELARMQNCEGIRFLGRVEQEAMPRLYDEADIFVNSSVVDNQPVSILEAFAAGLVVVTTATGDIGAMVTDTITGYLVPPEDPVALANTLVSVLEHPGQAARVTQHALDEVRKYAWPHVCNDWARAYMKERADETTTNSSNESRGDYPPHPAESDKIDRAPGHAGE